MYLYKDLYDHDWNSNGTVTRSNVNARNVTDDVTHSVAWVQVRTPIIFIYCLTINQPKPFVVKKKREKVVLTNISVKKSKKKTTTNDSSDHKECPCCKTIHFSYNMCQTCNVEKELKKTRLKVYQISYQVRNVIMLNIT